MIKRNIKFNLKSSFLFWLIALSFFIRVIIAYFFGDQHLENEWKILLHNLINHNSYSFFKFNDQLIPSLFMPPMYPFLLYFIKIIVFEKINFLNLIIFVQIIFSTYSVYIFFRLNQKIFSNKISLINSLIFSFFPLNLYASAQISSINFQMLLALLFMLYLFSLSEYQSNKNIYIFSLISGLLLLTRGEFILIFLITIFYMILCKKIKLVNLLKIIIIVSLIISPYVIRNYITFGQITIVKSFGYNLWKGNNHLSLVEGSEFTNPTDFVEPYQNTNEPVVKAIINKIKNIKINKYYEINRNKIFLEEAKNNLVHDPYRYFILFLKKIASYYFIDLGSNVKNYYNYFHIFPVLIVSMLSFPGIIIALKKNNFILNYLLVYLSLNLVIFSIFFILPRYKLIILPVQIILVTLFINYIYKKFFYRK